MDSGPAESFIHRHPPEANVWEAGLFLGGLFISDRNGFRGATVFSPGHRPIVQPVSRFDQPALEMGMRCILSAELRRRRAGGHAGGRADRLRQLGDVLAARAHAVVQLPYWSVVPFVVGGMGYWHVLNDFSGDDSDPAFHFGVGAKVNVTRSLSVRLDVRDSITNQRGDGRYPHNIEALAGANIVLGRSPARSIDNDADGVTDDRG